MRGHTLLMAAAACGILVGSSACDFPMDYREGAKCSNKGTCPPGQQCSPDGMCLKPCPVKDCTGTECGCRELSHWYGDNGDNGYVCQPDGLCHLGCGDLTFGCPGGDFVCDTGEGLCRHHCDTSDGGLGTCPAGAQCVRLNDWDVICVE